MSNDDALLRVALHEYYRSNINALFTFLEALHLHLYRIRNFLVIIKENLFADNLTHKEASRLISKLVFIEISWRLREQLLDTLQQHVYSKLILCRDRKNLSVWQQRMPFHHNVSKIFLVTLVYLIDEKQYWYIHLLHLLQEFHILFWILNHVSDVQQDVSISQCRLRESQHHLLHLVVRLQYSRSIRKHYLHIIGIYNSHDTMACCLRLEGSDRNTLTNQLIHQCRLTNIRVADDIHKTSLVHCIQ